jgi:[ribosomal protein S18]-alanine N-acetyltransferase
MTSLLRITEENQHRYLDSIIQIENMSFSTPWSSAGFLQEIRNPVSRLWAAMIDEDLKGYICFWMLDFEIQLLDLAVHPEERRKGLGRFLLNNMIEEAVSRNLESIWLEVRVSNTGAIRLYQNLGFVQVGLRRKYYQDTQEDAKVMFLALPGSVQPLKRHVRGGH